MSNTKHVGGCHCGAVRFEANVDFDKPVSRCNCSVCVRRNPSSAVIKPADFTVTKGEGEITSYAAGPGTWNFCKRCGIGLFGRGHLAELGGDYVAVNVHAIDDVDPHTLKAIYWDGRRNNWHAGPRETPWPVRA